MSNYQVYVLSQNGKPLMPTKRFGKVRRLLKSGRAKVVCFKPFTIQLLYKTSEYTQPLTLGIDPGSKKIGIAVRKENGELIEAIQLETRTANVTQNMADKRMHRRSRRQHQRKKRQRAKKQATCFKQKKYKIAGTAKELQCQIIKPKLVRFNNRRREGGWLTPTARHLLETHINLIKSIAKRLRIWTVCLEYGKFDLQKLDNPDIRGKQYQNGRKKGYANTREYVLCRDRHTCRLCKKTNVPLYVHHVRWKSEGCEHGPENLLTLCMKCHKLVHEDPKVDAKVKELFTGIEKRMVHTTLLNTIMPSFYQWTSQFASVLITYGYETKEKRFELKLPKQHHIDAYLTTLGKASEATDIDWNAAPVYKYIQVRRHHRQLIHATRDRNYKDGKKIVAKNRHKRLGQKQDSLADLIKCKGEKITNQLRVLPGKKVIRSKFTGFSKGDVVRYKGHNYVVKGYGEMGRRIGFVGHKDYVLTKKCRLIARNKGIVCL